MPLRAVFVILLLLLLFFPLVPDHLVPAVLAQRTKSALQLLEQPAPEEHLGRMRPAGGMDKGRLSLGSSRNGVARRPVRCINSIRVTGMPVAAEHPVSAAAGGIPKLREGR